MAADGTFMCEACGSHFLVGNDSGISASNVFDVVSGVLTRYSGSSVMICIPSEAVAIGDECFKDMELIESVFLPEGIQKIGARAFMGCKNLKYIHLPDTLTTIGDEAFRQSGLEELHCPQSLSVIGKRAFMDCPSLKTVSLPKPTSIVFDRTFAQCRSLENVDCNLLDFFPSFLATDYAKKKGDPRSTFFDAFQATQFLSDLLAKKKRKECLICSGKVSFLKRTCQSCGTKNP